MTTPNRQQQPPPNLNEELLLSQQLNQLLPFQSNQTHTNLLHSNVPLTKLSLLLKEIGINMDSVPDYLCKTDLTFEKTLQSIVPTTMNIIDFKNIARLMYKILLLESVKSLWIVYRKSIIGDLPFNLTINGLNKKVWPTEIQSAMKLFQANDNNNNNNNNNNNSEDILYLNFINECLQELDEQSTTYRKQMNRKISRLVGYNRSLECLMENFVQKGLHSKRLEIDGQIALVQYHHTDVLLKHVYLAQNPTENQIAMIKQLCKLKYNQEITKHEANFLKQKIPIYLTAQSFEKQSIATEISFLNDMSDTIQREQFYQQYKETAKEARSKMMSIILECAETQRDQYQQELKQETNQLWDAEKLRPHSQQLTQIMRNLINQRLDNISARIECSYKFKSQLLQAKFNL